MKRAKQVFASAKENSEAAREIDSARFERALTQRILLVRWEKTETLFAEQRETVVKFEVLGTRGITYTVKIGDNCTCSCPDFEQRGAIHKCKHILFVLCKLLGLSPEFARRTSFCTSDVEQWLQTAPVARLSTSDNETKTDGVTDIETKHPQRPLEEDPCPICYDDFQKGEFILYCSEQCGHNVHGTCYKRWFDSRKKSGEKEPICVFCRIPWKNSQLK